MLSLGIISVERINNGIEMFFITEKVGIGNIHENGAYVVLFNIMRIGLLYVEQIIVRDLLFVAAVTFADIFLQPVHRCVEINNNIRLDHLLQNDIEQSLVKPEFIFGQVHFGKQQAFGKEIIRDRHILKKVFLLNQFFQLLESFRHEKKFQREGILLRIFVKLGKKRIVCKLFQDQPRIKMFRKQVRKRGLARTNVSFDSYEIVIQSSLKVKSQKSKIKRQKAN
jgi:hypothetical protein